MRPLTPGALDLAQIDAELARELAHRRAGIGHLECRFVDRSLAAGAAGVRGGARLIARAAAAGGGSRPAPPQLSSVASDEDHRALR